MTRFKTIKKREQIPFFTLYSSCYSISLEEKTPLVNAHGIFSAAVVPFEKSSILSLNEKSLILPLFYYQYSFKLDNGTSCSFFGSSRGYILAISLFSSTF